MARNLGTILVNAFVRGLITEATGLNFPDNATTDSENVVYEQTGAVRRRKGFDIEGFAETLAYDSSDGVIKEFVWQAVAKTGGFTFLVLQMGNNVHFFELTTSEAISQGIQPVSINLLDYKAPEVSEINFIPCSFAAGAGYLFIAHPNCDPIIVRWDTDQEVFQASRVSVQIRDLEGVEDTEGLLENPSTLTDQHHYNLRNQGWSQQVRVGSVTNELGQGGELSSYVEPKLDWVNL